MKNIGLTGGIGSGKSTVAQVFEHLGVPVYKADDRAKELMHENAELKEAIQSEFGQEAYLDGKLNRSFLAEIVFKNEGRLKALNAIIHPAVRKDYLNWVEELADVPYNVREAAILFESGASEDCDHIISVSADSDIRIARVMARDDVSREQVLDRMKNQWTDEQRNKASDFIIYNNGEEMLLPQVIKIHESLINSKLKTS